MKSQNNEIRMGHSIRFRFTLYTFIFILLLVTAIVALNQLLMESYYEKEKCGILKEAMEQLQNVTDEELEDEDKSESSDYMQFFAVNNLDFVVSNEDNTTYYSNARDFKESIMAGYLFGYDTGIDQHDQQVRESGDNYSIQESRDRFMNQTYMEIWGTLDDGRRFLVRTPMTSIRDSAAIANSFVTRIGLLLAVLAMVIVWILMRRITRPITELTELSQRMAELDFEAKYTRGGKDEIAVLGRNFNTMSEELEKNIAQLKSANLELQKDIEKKEEIDEKRREFLSDVSHELKTPIALIQSYAEGLQEGISEDPESREFYCEVIIDEANKMNAMVRSLLNLNQLESGHAQVELTEFDLEKLVDSVLQAQHLKIGEKGIRVRFAGRQPVCVWGDEFRIEEVIVNYISNALNHISGEMILEIRFEMLENEVKTCVFNSGTPIPEEEQSRIWEKFYKVDKARTREYGGNGIGLSIVKAIMEAHGQRCGVNAYANGNEFWFTLERADLKGRQALPQENTEEKK